MNFANCADFNLPITGFDDCNPDVNYSEIERVFIGGPKAGPFANIANAAEWNTRMTQTTIGVDSVRALTVIGDMPAAAGVVKELSNGRKKQIGKDFTVNYTVDDISDENYTFFRTLDEQPLIRLFGFETQGGKMYHYGNAGIIVNHNSNGILARGRDEIETEAGVITWRNKQRPLRMTSPIFSGSGTVTPTTFDTNLDFDAATTDNAAGVNGTVSVADADQQFEFNAITPQVGTPASMTIKVGGVTEIVVDYTTDYNGSPFRYTDKAGVVHTGNFTNGIVNY
jgi:hypothetical protein